MGAFDVPDPKKVKTLEDLFAFVHYYHGITRGKSAYISFYKGYAKFLEKHPEWEGRGIAYTHLAKVCEWGVKNRKGRIKTTTLLLYYLDEAVKQGALPELEENAKGNEDDPLLRGQRRTEKESLEDQFYSILAIEDDPKWRSYLISTQGKLREQAITEWKQEHNA